MKAETTLITGASSGIGLHLAHEFAEHGHPLILVAPSQAELEGLKQEIETKHGVKVEIIPKDLERAEASREVWVAVEQLGQSVDILVNNAGHGMRGKSWEIPIEEDISMVRLNIEAVLRLTKLFIQPMVERGSGKILNTASIAGFEPGPMLAVYHATKAFVLSWSEALTIELEGSGVGVTALCPGATDTDFFPKADMVAVKAFQGSNVMAPQDVAKAGYEGLMKGELFVVPGGMNKMLVAARRILPESTQAKLNQSFYEYVPEEKVKRQRGDVELAAEKEAAEKA
jgi:short-subunit dehydrogenase